MNSQATVASNHTRFPEGYYCILAIKNYTLDMDIIDENHQVALRHFRRLQQVLNSDAKAVLRDLMADVKAVPEDIQLDQFHRLIKRLKPYQPDVTLRLFQSLTLSDFGLYGYACATAENLGQAIEFSIKFMALTTERYHELSEVDGRKVRIYPVTLPAYIDQAIDVDEDFVAGNCRLLDVLLDGDVDWQMVKIQFSHLRPDYGDVYDEVFQCDLAFGQPETCISFPKSWLRRPIISKDPSLAEPCVQRCFELLGVGNQEALWSDKVRRLIIESRFTVVTLAQAAARFNVSARTLREYLYREGTNFRQLLLEVRMTLAKHYLQITKMSGEEISEMLQYSQPSVFFRAFENWFGCTTKVVRQRPNPSSTRRAQPE